MSESSSQEKSDKDKVTPLRCLVGAFISGGLAGGLYLLTYSIAITFATKPITAKSQFAINIASAVRTLVVGMASLGTFIFAFVAFGLVLLAIQLTIQGIKQKLTSSSGN